MFSYVFSLSRFTGSVSTEASRFYLVGSTFYDDDGVSEWHRWKPSLAAIEKGSGSALLGRQGNTNGLFFYEWDAMADTAGASACVSVDGHDAG